MKYVLFCLCLASTIAFGNPAHAKGLHKNDSCYTMPKCVAITKAYYAKKNDIAKSASTVK